VFSEAQYKHHVFPHFFVGRISTRSCDSRTVKIIALRALLIEIMGSEDMGSKMHLFVWLMRAPTTVVCIMFCRTQFCESCLVLYHPGFQPSPNRGL